MKLFASIAAIVIASLAFSVPALADTKPPAKPVAKPVPAKVVKAHKPVKAAPKKVAPKKVVKASKKPVKPAPKK